MKYRLDLDYPGAIYQKHGTYHRVAGCSLGDNPDCIFKRLQYLL